MTRGIFHPDDADKFFKNKAGKPYRPSNGAEGDIFYAAWCNDCIHDDYDKEKFCPIIGDSMLYDVNHKKYPPQWVYGQDGQPRCTGFSDQSAGEPRCEKTIDLFGDNPK